MFRETVQGKSHGEPCYKSLLWPLADTSHIIASVIKLTPAPSYRRCFSTPLFRNRIWVSTAHGHPGLPSCSLASDWDHMTNFWPKGGEDCVVRGPHTIWLGGDKTRNQEQWGTTLGIILEPLLWMFPLGIAMVWMGPQSSCARGLIPVHQCWDGTLRRWNGTHAFVVGWWKGWVYTSISLALLPSAVLWCSKDLAECQLLDSGLPSLQNSGDKSL